MSIELDLQIMTHFHFPFLQNNPMTRIIPLHSMIILVTLQRVNLMKNNKHFHSPASENEKRLEY